MAKKKKKSRFSSIKWMIITLLSSGGLGGFMKPDLPFIGPLTQRLMAFAKSDESLGQGNLMNQVQANITGARNGVAGLNGQQAAPAQLANSNRPSSSILIASFNIQVLGKSKMEKPSVVEVLARVIRQFDVVAIQEVRAKEDNILPQLVAAVNADGHRYNFIIGPRLGRTVSKEQYAFVYDTTRIEQDPSATGTLSDPTDLMHREPFVARFRARTNPPEQGFSFWLMNAHTDPDEVPEEVDALSQAFPLMLNARADEDDVILLGDLNASEQQFGNLGKIPNITWTVTGNTMTNTRQNKAYDNILFDRIRTSEYTGRWGVYDIEGVFGISREDALMVSDHLPVWAEFSAWEAAPNNRMADRFPNNQPR
jgi:deoxyribonuclease-1-like protein